MFFNRILLTAPNPDALFGNWRQSIMSWASAAISGLIVPVGILLLLAFSIINLVKFFAKKRQGQGDETKEELIAIFLGLVGIVILLTHNAWLPFISGGYL